MDTWEKDAPKEKKGSVQINWTQLIIIFFVGFNAYLTGKNHGREASLEAMEETAQITDECRDTSEKLMGLVHQANANYDQCIKRLEGVGQ